MLGFLKKLFGKDDAAAPAGQVPAVPGPEIPVPGAVDQVGTPPSTAPSIPTPTVQVAPQPPVEKPA